MSAPTIAAPGAAFTRDTATWYGYLLIGSYLYLLNVQGNVIPFLQAEFSLSYRVVSLHSSAIAVGVILVGLFGERVTRAIGRRNALWLGGGGLGAGALLLTVSPAPWASIGSCFLIGVLGSFLPSVIPAILSDIHGARRDEAYAEQAVLAYAFAIVGPLSTGFFISVGLGWRPSVVLGGVFALALVVAFRRLPLPDTPRSATASRARLPAPFWAYWALLVCSCALEFSVLLWSPAFLERVVGLAPATAATAAAGFYAGMLAGRIALRGLLRRLSGRTILVAAFAVGFIGFGLYWGVDSPVAAIVGIVCLGLCVAPLYPLTMAFGVGVAKGANDAASARLTLAFGIAVLVAPVALGTLADQVGLRLAHLTLPALMVAALASFAVARALERRAA